MKLIVIDEDQQSQSKLQGYSEELGFTCYSFTNHEEFQSWRRDNSDVAIDFLLLAVNSSDQTSFELSIPIKQALKLTSTLSIIFLLSDHNDKNYIKSLKYGDGYLLKPFSSDLLLSSLNYHNKHSKLTELLARKNEKLVEYQGLVTQEHKIVESLFSNHYDKHLIKHEAINFHISPASIFNGDVMLTTLGPSGSLYVAVGDVTGHGLPAAIGAMPVYSTFRTMAAKGKNIGSIAEEMNNALRSLLPDNMMMALIIMELDFSQGVANIWSGGMPDVLRINKKSEIIQSVPSRHAPLSVLEPESFRKDIDIIELNDGDRLYFFTDGIEEGRNRKGEMFGMDRFFECFGGRHSQEARVNVQADRVFKNIIDRHTEFIQGNDQDDDITLVEVAYFDLYKDIALPLNKETSKTRSIPWHMSVSLSAAELKQADPIAQIIHFIDGSIDVNVHQDCVSTIISEIFNNALEHGLLKLDSSIKDQDDGFYDYYFARKQKLLELDEGTIDMELDYRIVEETGQGLLAITITDSGDGFEISSVQSKLDATECTHGRGISLLATLCSEIEFKNHGRTTVAHYPVER